MSNTVSDELKPCPNPWCTFKTAPMPVAHALNAGTSTYWRVQCGCGVQTFSHATSAEALADWNTLPQQPSSPARKTMARKAQDKPLECAVCGDGPCRYGTKNTIAKRAVGFGNCMVVKKVRDT